MNRFVTSESITGLVEKLKLPPPDPYSQDWEYEIASSELAIELLEEYVIRHDLSEDERFTLMIVLLASVDRFISERSEDYPYFTLLRKVLRRDYSTHKETIHDLAAWEQTEIEDAFDISPFARSIEEDGAKS